MLRHTASQDTGRRHFPYLWTLFPIRKLERLGRPAIVYMHPYEFEDSYPKIIVESEANPLKLRIHLMMQGHNREKKRREKLRLLLSSFAFTPLKAFIAAGMQQDGHT